MKYILILLLAVSFLSAPTVVKDGTYTVFIAEDIEAIADTATSREYSLINVSLTGDFAIHYWLSAVNADDTIRVQLYMTQGAISGRYTRPIRLDSIDNVVSYETSLTISNFTNVLDYMIFYAVSLDNTDTSRIDSLLFKVKGK